MGKKEATDVWMRQKKEESGKEVQKQQIKKNRRRNRRDIKNLG